MNEVDALREARALNEQGWTQGALARDRDGHEVHPCDKIAEAFCMSGAVNAAVADDILLEEKCFDLLQVAIGEEDGFCLAQWNDMEGRTQAEVLAAFDKAIEAAE